MKTYKGTEKATRGSYLNLKKWDFAQVEADNDVLPGETSVSYVKVPTALAMVAGPLTGMLFLVFLPFIGIAGFFGFLAYKAYTGVKALGVRMGRAVVATPQPGAAYFTKETKGSDDHHEADEELTALEEEVARRKKDETDDAGS
jgi:hypothetical protein